MTEIAKTPDPPYWAVIFTSLRTDVDEGYGDVRTMTRRVEEMGLSERVHWPGYVTDRWKALSGLDILVSSSLYGEGVSNTILEAMAAGRVVVATDVGDAKRLLETEEGQAGYVVPPGESIDKITPFTSSLSLILSSMCNRLRSS